MGNKTYVIADLHGRCDLLTMALNAIFDRHDEPGTSKIITLGDYVDRGPESRQVIETLMEVESVADGKLICLKGNHEDIMWQTCQKLPHCDWWIGNGGASTLVSYGHPESGPIYLNVVLDDHLHWIWSRPMLHEDGHRYYVHAGLRRDWPLEKQLEGDEPSALWMLYGYNDDYGFRGKHVVHGHHQFAKGPLLKKNRTDLDTFAWMTGRLVIGVFDDGIPGGPIDLIEIKGSPA